MPRSQIIGTGHYLPPKVVTNFDVMKMMETSDEFITTRTGVKHRRHAEADVSASDLGLLACRAAVADAGIEMDQIDLLICNTITPDHADPGTGFFLQGKLGIPGIAVMDVKQQCAGLIYGMAIADHFIRAGTYRYAMICCTEVLSKRIDGSYDGRNIAILLGDGAGAVVMGPGEDDGKGVLFTGLHADGSHADALYTPAPGTALDRMQTVTKDDIDAGRVHFRMDGRCVFENGVAGMTNAALEALAKTGLTLDDIDVMVPHQANLRMLEQVIEKVGIDPDKVFLNVVDHGNMASACLPIAIDQARKQGIIADGKLVLLAAFGSGFVWASAVVQM